MKIDESLSDELSMDGEGTLDSNFNVSIKLRAPIFTLLICPNFEISASHRALYQK